MQLCMVTDKFFFLLNLQRKQRFSFTIDRDIVLLKLALTKNPWQTGDQKWETIREIMEAQCQSTMTERCIKNRVNLLLRQYRTQQLQCKTGTEQEISDRGRLLESIDMIVQEENAAININLTADNDEFSCGEENIEEIECEIVLDDQSAEKSHTQRSVDANEMELPTKSTPETEKKSKRSEPDTKTATD